MSHLFETIQIKNGAIQNLAFHNLRFNKARREIYQLETPLDLKEYIEIPKYYQNSLVKCRISYSKQIHKVSFEHYYPRVINSIKLVHSNNINYVHKYEDRNALKSLFLQRQGHSEILIVKKGWITDCFYYNVAFFDGEWWTPEHCLLEGTMRAALIQQGIVKPRKIQETEIKGFKKISLFNALNDFGNTELSVEQIS